MAYPQPKVALDLHPLYAAEEKKVGRKDLVVCHETISPDYPGLTDVRGVAEFLDREGLEIHGIVDAEGNFAWSKGDRLRFYDHVASSGSRGFGNVAERSIGIELVSRPPVTLSEKRLYWTRRERQRLKLAKVLAWIYDSPTANDLGRGSFVIPLRYSDSSPNRPGVTTHWSVTTRWGVPGGHVDCWPRHLGGYFPVRRILRQARALAALR